MAKNPPICDNACCGAVRDKSQAYGQVRMCGNRRQAVARVL